MIEHRIQGIPCLIEVTLCHVVEPQGRNADSDWDCYGYSEIEYNVLDRRGRIAPWLERKMTDDDKELVEEKILNNRNTNH